MIDCDTATRRAWSPNPRNRSAIARRRDIPHKCACDIFYKLSNDATTQVREEVAKNTSIPEECACNIFDKLSDAGEDLFVRLAVAENNHIPHRCSSDIFYKLAKDRQWDVRQAVSQNESIPADGACIIYNILKDEFPKATSYNPAFSKCRRK